MQFYLSAWNVFVFNDPAALQDQDKLVVPVRFFLRRRHDRGCVHVVHQCATVVWAHQAGYGLQPPTELLPQHVSESIDGEPYGKRLTVERTLVGNDDQASSEALAPPEV